MLFRVESHLIASLLLAGCNSHRAAESNNRKTVHVREFDQIEVIGFLGVPMGEIALASVEFVDGDTLREKQFAGTTVLRLKSVDGERGFERDLWHFSTESDLQDFRPGDSAECYVSEYGGFWGFSQRPDLNIVSTTASVGRGFSTTLHVHKLAE